MSSGFSSGVAIDPATARGRDWPCLRQFCVFMENRVGQLHDLLRQVERHDLRVVGLSVVDTVDSPSPGSCSTTPTSPASR